MTNERYDAYDDLGGHTSELSEEQELAFYNAGIGTKEMRAKVAKRLERQNNAAQSVINHAGADAVRLAKIELDRDNGIDVDSPSYRAKLIIEHDRRNSKA